MRYPLWEFKLESLDTDFPKQLDGATVATRGTLEEAKRFMIARHRGYRITPQTTCYITSTIQYSQNHALGWQDRMPVWLSKEQTNAN